MNKIMKVTTNKNNEQIVSARSLYRELGIKKRFSEWWAMNSKGFIGNVDFTPYFEVHPQNKQNIQNYAMILDMAKHLAIQTQSQKGFEVRTYFIEVEKQYKRDFLISSSEPSELEIKRMNAEARLKNANNRQAKLLSELSKTTSNEVNKVLLEDKAVEILTGKKLLEMPSLKQHLFDSKEIAKKVGVLSKAGKPHETAISQLIKREIDVQDDEFEIVPETVGNWGGSVTKYAESVINKVEDWLELNNFPTVIQGNRKKYHVKYGL